MKKKQDGRVTIPQMFWIARTPELSYGAKNLWVIYRSYESADRGAYVSVDTIARDHMNTSTRTVERYRQELRHGGFLDMVFRGPHPADYRAILPPRAPTQASGQAPTGMSEQEKSSDTSSDTSTDTGVGQSTGSTGSTDTTTPPQPPPRGVDDLLSRVRRAVTGEEALDHAAREVLRASVD